MALCVIGAGETVRIAATVFSLSWMHSVEKIPWQEYWRVEPDRLVLTEARVKGSGAGMEPPADARHEDGWYVWTPADGVRDRIVLRAVPEISPWTICLDGERCSSLEALLGRKADPITIQPCS